MLHFFYLYSFAQIKDKCTVVLRPYSQGQSYVPGCVEYGGAIDFFEEKMRENWVFYVKVGDTFT